MKSKPARIFNKTDRCESNTAKSGHQGYRKFLPKPGAWDAVFLADDDILYGPGYVDHMLKEGARLGLEQHVLGLHETIYKRRLRSLRSRRQFYFSKRLRHSVVVDQPGTGTVQVLGRSLPEFALMQDAQRFVDMRFAHLCRQNGLSLVCVARPPRPMLSLGTKDGSIYQTFSRNSPKNVLKGVREITASTPLIGMRN